MTVVSSGVAIALGILVIAPFRQAHAQPSRRELVGKVRDSTGTPIEGALVQIPGRAARTDTRGTFQLWTSQQDTVTLSVRRLGYQALQTLLTARGGAWDTVVVELDATARLLAPVAVEEHATRRALGLRDFDERRARGLGVFVTRDQIAAHHTMQPSDVLRSVRGVTLVRLRNGTYGVRFTLYGATRPTCVPDMWIDGQLARGAEIDDLTSNDIEAMELYQSWSSAPLEFSQASVVPCGTVVIWTRVPGR